MAKQAKLPQTDYTRGGRDISNTSIPLYQSNLRSMGTYLEDPTARQDLYMNKYFGPEAVQNTDMLRNYNRAMGLATANNYAATGGGLSSSGQRAYDDQQRYYNDLLSRLQGSNVSNAYNMSSQDFQNMLNANESYRAAYGLGAPYSQTEQQNALIDAQNRNWWSSAMSGVGSVLSAIPTPPTMVLGAGLQTAGAATAIDTSNAQNALASIYGGQGVTPVTQNNTYTNLANTLRKADWSPLVKYYNGEVDFWGKPIVSQGIDSQGRTTLTRKNGPTIRG